MWGMKKSAPSSILISVFLLVMGPAACDNGKSRTFTVGVLNISRNLDESLVGFKEGMTELGYTEGKNIHYLYDGPTKEISKLSVAARNLLAAKVDLILTITTPATLAAKEATAGIGLPVVFAIVTDPVGAGIVKSMRQPGGNITGVTFGPQEARRLEWLVRIAPDIRQIYAPFNPKDKSPVLALKMVRNAAAKLGVELITREVHDPETLEDAVLNIPAEADAVFLLPDSYIGTRMPDLVATATKRNLPFSVPNIMDVQNYDILTSFGIDQHLAGKQTARLADQIFKGARPADLPVETAEFYLAVNLKTAETIGLTIPDEILRQAHLIVR
jgi:putative ABC transport system substrate-binding protein